MTPSGVRDGDPAALAGLCDRRGPAVLAYCHHVAGDAAAVAAAAEAFGAFRAAVVAAQDPAAINPEALLINATRQAAARHATITAPGICAAVPRLLAARADRSISLAELDRLQEHLDSCWTCRAPVARFEAAERAYRDPPDTRIPPQDAALIVAALSAAAPVRADEPEPPPPPPPPLTADRAPEPVAAGTAEPTTEFRPPPEIYEQPPAAPEPRPERRGRSERSAQAAPRRPRRPPRLARAPKRARAATPATAQAAPATHIPRPQRAGASARGRERGAAHQRSTLRRSVVLPIVLVAFALLIALFVSGVFGADNPAPTSGSGVTPSAATPQQSTTTPEILVVPGAADASAGAVEREKARARAKRRRQAQLDATPATPAATATPPPAAAAAPPPAARPKPASAPKPAGNGTGGSTGIDADNGATGAEQLPQAQDTSTVPELAPPPDPVLPPPG